MTRACATTACAVCSQVFERRSTTQRVCSPRCAFRLVRADKRQAAAARRADRVSTREKLESLKPLAKLRAEAQTAFNAFIRARDRKAGYGCICCGAMLEWDSDKPGGAVDAGHFVSRGAAIELAFDESNVNAQRKSCNRPGGTTRDQFRAGMLLRYGAAVVAELEGPHELPRLKHDDLRAIRDTYRRRARELAAA